MKYTPLAIALLVLGLTRSAGAQHVPRDQAVIGTSVVAAPNPLYESGALHKIIFGTDYRSVWAIPVSIPVLDIGNFAGGLTPLKQGGFGQTTSLHMRGAAECANKFGTLFFRV